MLASGIVVLIAGNNGDTLSVTQTIVRANDMKRFSQYLWEDFRHKFNVIWLNENAKSSSSNVSGEVDDSKDEWINVGDVVEDEEDDG